MDQKILKEYEKVKDKISEEEFNQKLEELKKEYENNSFIVDIDIARMIVGSFQDEEVESISTPSDGVKKINTLLDGEDRITIIGKVFSISQPKDITSKKKKQIRLSKVTLADDTGEIVTTFWSENIKHIKKFSEGDVIQIDNLVIKRNYQGDGVDANLTPRSMIKVLDASNYSNFPDYAEEITNIEDLVADENANIIGRITRISPPHSYESNGKTGQVASFELQDSTGKINYTLWNNDVNFIEKLELSEGDSVKILNVQPRERNGELSISHWDGRIIKGDFDVPEYKEEILKIQDARESNDVNLLGLVTKIQDTIEFERQDGSPGKVKSITITDDTSKIKLTLWNDDTNLDINKGDILKVIGANIKFDEYAETGYSANANWNTRIVINPDEESSLIDVLNEYKKLLGPKKIASIQDYDEDEGEEVDVRGRLVSVFDVREFERDDGSLGLVRSADLADETGLVRVSFWDEKAEGAFNLGSAFLIENARTRMGLDAIDLNVGKVSRIIPLTDEQSQDLPSLEELEEMIYTTKKIADLEEDDSRIRVVGRIIDLSEPNEFARADGEPGVVRSIEIADETGIIKGSLWDNQAEIYLDIGDPIKIQNPRVTYRNDDYELSIGVNSQVERANEEDTKDLPSREDLESTLYVPKTIDQLEDDDKNVKFTGKIVTAFGNKILLNKCPSCNNSIEMVDDEYVCDYCGESFDKPKYTLMIPTVCEDESENEISVTFFGKLAEELIGMSTDEIVELINDSGDEGALEGKVEDLVGLNITIIADVNFNEYDEELRLNPRRIISKEL